MVLNLAPYKAGSITFLMVLLLGFSLHAQAPKARDEDPEFVTARKLFWSGQYKESESKFKLYLQAYPKDEATKSFLQMIDQSRKYDPEGIDQTRKRLETIKIPKVEFKESDWRVVSTYFQDLANNSKNSSKDGKPPKDYINFINMLPSGFSIKVSLNLRDVSLLEAIEHACEQAGLRHVIDTWAVIIDIPESKTYAPVPATKK